MSPTKSDGRVSLTGNGFPFLYNKVLSLAEIEKFISTKYTSTKTDIFLVKEPCFVFLKHYSLVIPIFNLEIQPQNDGTFLRINDNYMSGKEIVSKKIVCKECLLSILKRTSIEYPLFPFNNCESVSKSIFGESGLSFQSIYILNSIISLVILLSSIKFIYVLLYLILIAVIVYMSSNRTGTFTCAH